MECKFAYYYPDQCKKKCPKDEYYDKIESEYRQLAEELGKPTSAADYVGFPKDKPCGRLVMNKQGKRSKK